MEAMAMESAPMDGEPPAAPSMCRMAFSLPTYSCCLVQSTHRHPEMTIEVLSGLPISDTEMVEDVRMTGPVPPDTWVEELRSCPGVRSVEVLRSEANTMTFRIRHPICPIVRLHQQLGVPPTLPATIEKGVHNVIFTASPEELRRIYNYSRKRYRDVRIMSLRHAAFEGHEALLTERQQAVFREAYLSGYWDVPRRASASSLAQRLHVSKSTLVEIMTRIESRLMHAAADDVVGGTGKPALGNG